MQQLIDAATLRAEVARHKIPLYKLAAIVDLHPSRLGEFLNERRPLPADLALRLLAAIEAWGRQEPDE